MRLLIDANFPTWVIDAKSFIAVIVVCVAIVSCVSPYHDDAGTSRAIPPENASPTPLSAGEAVSRTEPTSTVVPTQSPPENAVALDIVDASDGMLPPKGHEHLLISACAEVSQQDYDSCDLGFFDFENIRFTKFAQSQESDYDRARFEWSPDGTQFFYSRGSSWFTSLYSITVFTGEGNTTFESSMFYDYAQWSPDGRYLSFETCRGSRASPESVLTRYDARSWEAICSVHSGPAMICVPLAGPCELLPATSTPITSQQESPANNRYQAIIENGRLRIFDSQTGITNTYVMPGDRKIKAIALWTE
ncbi:MAG: hypothetical protein JXA21_26745 [Anaerolineae bacterium]|nr:hypothetical protein [Anaerolineae bacterium]